MNVICNRQYSRKEIQQSSIRSSQVIETVWIGHEIPSETDLCFASSEIHVCSGIFRNCAFAIKKMPTCKYKYQLRYENTRPDTTILHLQNLCL